MATYKPVLPLDLTGTSADNLIADEEHILDQGQKRLIIPKYGSFFEAGLKLFHPVLARDLVKDTEYMIVELYQKASLETGKAVFNAIIITDQTLDGSVMVDYQALGGPFMANNEELLAWVNATLVNPISIAWDDLKDKPREFNPEEHYQHIRDLYGTEYLVDELKRIEEAIDVSTIPIHSQMKGILKRRLADATVEANTTTTDFINQYFAEFAFFNGKNVVGLSNLNNYAPMTPEKGYEIAKPSYYVRDNDELFYLTLSALGGFAKGLRDNFAIKEDTGLDLRLPIYREPNKASMIALPNAGVFMMRSKLYAAENGLHYDKGIYPKDVTEGEEFAVMRLSHNDANHGGAWMGYSMQSHNAYLGTLRNDGCATQFEWVQFLKDGGLNEFNALIEAHIVDYKNPHNVGKADIKLDLVENLPVVTPDEIQGDKGVFKYVTLDTLMYYMRKFLTNAGPPVTDDGEPDPNRRLMSEDHIIFSTCKKCLSDPHHPPKGQLVRTWCDGTERFAKWTDGDGGTYDELLQMDSDDCKYYDMPEDGKVLATFCEGQNKMATIADGKGGHKDVIAELNSDECGVVPAGTKLGEYCAGQNKMGRIADGKGGTYDEPIEQFSPDCGLPHQPSAGTVLREECRGEDRWSWFADGKGGEYEHLTGVALEQCGNKPAPPAPPPPPPPEPEPPVNPGEEPPPPPTGTWTRIPVYWSHTDPKDVDNNGNVRIKEYTGFFVNLGEGRAKFEMGGANPVPLNKTALASGGNIYHTGAANGVQVQFDITQASFSATGVPVSIRAGGDASSAFFTWSGASDSDDAKLMADLESGKYGLRGITDADATGSVVVVSRVGQSMYPGGGGGA